MVRSFQPGEISVLRALRDMRNARAWQGAGELAQQLDMPTWAVRSILKELARQGLVRRGHSIEDVYRWALTENGLQALCSADQLRLIR